ncbi:MAG: hypothetical protein V4639_08160 [Pseudomonadota bacterium]
MDDHAIRMYADANARLADADILAGSLNRQSDSAALLSILGFEVLLKCAIVLSGTSPKNNHKYAAQWSTLPESVRNEILSSAVSRMPGYTDFSDLNKLLIAYQFAFEKGRYHYEFFKDYSLVEQFELSQFWMDLGAPLDEALVQYFPNELTCLIHGLRRYIERRLGERNSDTAFSKGEVAP